MITYERSTLVNSEKYIGLDVHHATISVAVLDHTGKLVMECILETKAATILEFFAGLRGTLSVTFEEATSAAWLYDLLSPHVARLVVCNPRKNALLKQGNKTDRIDARARDTGRHTSDRSCQSGRTLLTSVDAKFSSCLSAAQIGGYLFRVVCAAPFSAGGQRYV
jgi:hypothetical protein